MLSLRILSLLLVAVVPRGVSTPAHRAHAVGWEEVMVEVQDAIKSLVNHRSSFLHDEMKKTCLGKDFMLMKINIVKGPHENDTIYENYAHWGDNCVFHVYDSGVVSLQNWCLEDPARHLIYEQNQTEAPVPGTQMIVNTKCHLFEEDPDDYYRNLTDNFIKMFIIIASVSAILTIINWLFRRDVMVVVNNASPSEKSKESETPLLQGEKPWKTPGGVMDPSSDKALLLENQEENESA
uniref:Transmembrane protein 156 n=1 Tax=Caenorhabditis tropicalis TaxID=1561998 RepID=A0A1I7UGY1_9PELO